MPNVIQNRNPKWEKPEHQVEIVKAYMKLNELRSLMDSSSFLIALFSPRVVRRTGRIHFQRPISVTIPIAA